MSEQQMFDDLKKSGLVPQDMDTFLEDRDAMQGRSLGYRIPYYLPDGQPHPTMWQTKLFTPKEDGQKYTQPAGVTFPYFSPRVDWQFERGNKTKFIVEGAKKAAAAIKHLQVAAIGINGCWNWHGEPTKKFLRPLSEPLADFIQAGDTVYVVLDGDAAYNIDVENATADLRLAILRHGAVPIIVKLPDEGDHKIGLDDWIVATNATRDDFFRLPMSSDGRDYRESMNSLAHRTGMTRYPTGGLHTTNHNAILAVKATECFKGVLLYDAHRMQWSYNGEPVAERHYTLLRNEIARRFMPQIGPTVAGEVLASLEAEEGYFFHPLRDYLNSLAWDGEKRLEGMFQTIFGAEDSEYMKAVGRNFLTSAVARALRPGCKVDTMLILEGKQGIGKTRAFAIMGRGSHTESSTHMDSKDFVVQLQSTWFLDIAELDALHKAEISRVKALLSMTEDVFRPPYGRVSIRRPRECVFVGSTNTSQYLIDSSGGRRFWPIACGDTINIPLLEECIDQLYAEAVHRFRSGETWWETPEHETAAQQDARSTTDALPWFDYVAGYTSNPAKLRKIKLYGQRHLGIKPSELLNVMDIPLERQNVSNIRDMGRILVKLGFKQVALRAVNMEDGGADLGDRQQRYYVRPITKL